MPIALKSVVDKYLVSRKLSTGTRKEYRSTATKWMAWGSVRCFATNRVACDHLASLAGLTGISHGLSADSRPWLAPKRLDS